jgi:2-amino-4-hydroxy-6-hydroxymethyldihydropteridine diphosphokinase
MPEVIIAIGSNMGDRLEHLAAGLKCLEGISLTPVRISPIYECEPIGPGSMEFLNAVVLLQTKRLPIDLLPLLKECERNRGRDPHAPRWSDRPLDMDIIGWGRRTFNSPTIQVPHASYRDRLFVLLPLKDLCPDWIDPETGIHIDRLVEGAMPMQIQKSDISIVNS